MKSLTEKAQKEMPEFADNVASMSVEQLDATLAQLAKDAEAVSKAKEDDEELTQVKQQAQEMGAPYRDARKAISLKTKFVISLIMEKGGKV